MRLERERKSEWRVAAEPGSRSVGLNESRGSPQRWPLSGIARFRKKRQKKELRGRFFEFRGCADALREELRVRIRQFLVREAALKMLIFWLSFLMEIEKVPYFREKSIRN